MMKISKSGKIGTALIAAVFVGAVITITVNVVTTSEVKQTVPSIIVSITEANYSAKIVTVATEIEDVESKKKKKKSKKCKNRHGRKKHQKCHDEKLPDEKMVYSKDFFGVGVVDSHVEYAHVVLDMTCEAFFAMMWNPANDIYRQIMIREEMSQFTILNGDTKSTANITLIRQMHAPMAPPQALQHVTLTTEHHNGFTTRQLFTITDNVPFSDKFDVCEQWDVKPIGSGQCQVRMSGRSVWRVSWHWAQGMINGLVGSSFKQLGKNFVDEMTNESVLVANLLKTR